MTNKIYHFVLKSSALIMPCMIMYYGLLYDRPESKISKELKRYVTAGFIFYLVVAVVILATKK